MDKQQHIERHIKLHKAVDELFADYIEHHPDQGNYTDMPVMQLIEWSYEQTTQPTEVSGEEK